MLRIAKTVFLLQAITLHSVKATLVFQKNGHGCADALLTDLGSRKGELFVNDKYNHDCDWTVQMPNTMTVHAIIMHIYDVWIDCSKGYLRFLDEDGTGCGICEQVDTPSDFCQIYVKENVCTESEIWKAVADFYPYCTRSIIHTGFDHLSVHLVTMGAGWREFVLDYTLFECKGPRSTNEQYMGKGPPHPNPNSADTTLTFHCSIVLAAPEPTTSYKSQATYTSDVIVPATAQTASRLIQTESRVNVTNKAIKLATIGVQNTHGTMKQEMQQMILATPPATREAEEETEHLTYADTSEEMAPVTKHESTEMNDAMPQNAKDEKMTTGIATTQIISTVQAANKEKTHPASTDTTNLKESKTTMTSAVPQKVAENDDMAKTKFIVQELLIKLLRSVTCKLELNKSKGIMMTMMENSASVDTSNKIGLTTKHVDKATQKSTSQNAEDKELNRSDLLQKILNVPTRE